MNNLCTCLIFCHSMEMLFFKTLKKCESSKHFSMPSISFLGFFLDGPAERISHTPSLYRDLVRTLDTLQALQTIKVYERLAGLWTFYFSLFGTHYHVLRPLHIAAVMGCPPSPESVELFAFVLAALPASMPFAMTTVLHEAYADASSTGLGLCLPQGSIAVLTNTPRTIHKRELWAVFLTLLVAPPRTLVRCDNKSVVAALTRGHGCTFTILEAFVAVLLLANKSSWLKWIPTTDNPADAPSRLHHTISRGNEWGPPPGGQTYI